MDKDIVSIIIPAYNAEKYIGRCLDSLIAQTFKQLDILVIDDGSTDSTAAIVEDYADKSGFVHLISKENGGVSAARNTGIGMMKGSWCMFVDADDWLLPDTVERLYNETKASDADVIVYSIANVFTDHESDMLLNDADCMVADLINGKQIVGDMDLVLCSPCNKFYKASVIKDNGIFFTENVKYGEDFIFNSIVFSKVQKLKTCHDIKYYYDCSIPNSGVKRLYENYNEFIVLMKSSLDKLMKASNIKDNECVEFRLNFIAQKWIYALNVLLDSNRSQDDKVRILSIWIQDMDISIIQYLANYQSEFQVIAKNILVKNIDKESLKRMLNYIQTSKKRKLRVMAFKRFFKQLIYIR